MMFIHIKLHKNLFHEGNIYIDCIPYETIKRLDLTLTMKKASNINLAIRGIVVFNRENNEGQLNCL